MQMLIAMVTRANSWNAIFMNTRCSYSNQFISNPCKKKNRNISHPESIQYLSQSNQKFQTSTRESVSTRAACFWYVTCWWNDWDKHVLRHTALKSLHINVFSDDTSIHALLVVIQTSSIINIQQQIPGIQIPGLKGILWQHFVHIALKIKISMILYHS